MEYEHIKMLLQGKGGVKSIIFKKRYACQIKFDRTSVNLNIERIQGAKSEIIFEQLFCLLDVLT